MDNKQGGRIFSLDIFEKIRSFPGNSTLDVNSSAIMQPTDQISTEKEKVSIWVFPAVKAISEQLGGMQA